MRLHLPKPLLLPTLALSLALLSCDRDITSTEDQPLVDYVLIVSDSLTSAPLESVKIRVTAINGDTSTYYTDRQEGRAELATLSSSRTLFVLSKTGYKTLDILDTVNAKPDTVFNRPVQRLLRAKLVNLRPDSGRVQVQLLIRNPNLQKLKKGRVTFTDSTGTELTVTDNDTDGTVPLSGLNPGSIKVRVEHADQLGQRIELKVEKSSDSSHKVPSNTVVLPNLDNSISGQVLFKTAAGNKALLDARVEFHFKDSTAYPPFMEVMTDPDLDKGGYFEFPRMPALEGTLRFYKDRNSVEHVDTLRMTREEVMRDGAIKPVVLTLNQGSNPRPVALKLPKDTLAPRDFLVFEFSQPVVRMVDPVVSLINISQKLWVKGQLDSSRKILKVAQAEDDWVPGKQYAYELSLTNVDGEPFTRPGDTASVIRGGFFVKESLTVDSSLTFPKGIRMAYFNSGKDRRFDSSHVETSRLADSTSRFARMKWSWASGKGNRVDSLLIFLRDGGSRFSSWTQWTSIPGFADSATLDFSELYSVSGMPSQNEAFPLRITAGAEISIKLLFQEGGRTLDSQVVLPAVKQGMGPRVYARYDTLDGLNDSLGAVDSIEVAFRRGPSDTSALFDFGSSPPTPKLYVGTVKDTVNLKWSWIPGQVGKKGRLKYSVPANLPPFSLFRVDLGDETFEGRPIWHRNRHDGVGFD